MESDDKSWNTLIYYGNWFYWTKMIIAWEIDRYINNVQQSGLEIFQLIIFMFMKGARIWITITHFLNPWPVIEPSSYQMACKLSI